MKILLLSILFFTYLSNPPTTVEAQSDSEVLQNIVSDIITDVEDDYTEHVDDAKTAIKDLNENDINKIKTTLNTQSNLDPYEKALLIAVEQHGNETLTETDMKVGRVAIMAGLFILIAGAILGVSSESNVDKRLAKKIVIGSVVYLAMIISAVLVYQAK